MFATQLTHAPWDAGDSLKDQQKPLVCGKGNPKTSNFSSPRDLFMNQLCLGWKAHVTWCHRIIRVQIKKPNKTCLILKTWE